MPTPLPLSPNARATHDRAPDSLAAGTPAPLLAAMRSIMGPGNEHQVLHRLIDLVKYASDASPYRLFPQVVVCPTTERQIIDIFAWAAAQDPIMPVTIRAAGSSLSGQAQGDGILIDVRKNWAGWTVLDEGERIKVKPGTVMFRANLALAPYGFRLGPDPASVSVCTVGGVIANNSSGMCCGTVQNSYQTLEAIRFVLPSGTAISTDAPEAEDEFARREPTLAAGLLAIKAKIEADSELVERIRRKYTIKNTTGYHMQAFLDGATPLEIFRRLLVGSEGTLAFISSATFTCVPSDPHRLTALLIFADLYTAASAVAPFVDSGAAAVELCDRASLRAVQGKPGVPARWADLPATACGLLVEYREANEALLAIAETRLAATLADLQLYEPANFTRDPAIAAQLWTVRAGLLPSVGGARPSGTSLILEDVCFPAEHLAQGAIDLQELMQSHGFPGFVFGHASAGNLHFLITPSLNDDQDIARYDAFMQAVVSLVVDKYDGSLKAEHGTGRNVAPFVQREWGPKLTEYMWHIKNLADPKGILAPGVLLSHDQAQHLKHLHTTPTTEPEVDRCIECGYCEAICPSRDLTTTPRQRIVLRREMLRQQPGSAVYDTLARQYRYDAIETCAGDGTCAIACPLDINTGDLIKHFRAASHGPAANTIAFNTAKYWATIESAARAALNLNWLANRLGLSRLTQATLSVVRSILPKDLVPSRMERLPAGATLMAGEKMEKIGSVTREEAAAIYFSACVNRIFGEIGQSHITIQEALCTVSAKAGLPLHMPPDLAGNCCATPWHSKGFEQGNEYMANRTVEALWRWSDGGRLPIVCDASSCTLGLKAELRPYLSTQNQLRHSHMTIIDSVDWLNDRLLPALQANGALLKKAPLAVLHPTCSTHNLGTTGKLSLLAHCVASKVVAPLHATCCGMAGDRGMLHPELTASATHMEVADLAEVAADALHLSSNKTCEIGMSEATGRPYRSIVFALCEALTS